MLPAPGRSGKGQFLHTRQHCTCLESWNHCCTWQQGAWGHAHANTHIQACYAQEPGTGLPGARSSSCVWEMEEKLLIWGNSKLGNLVAALVNASRQASGEGKLFPGPLALPRQSFLGVELCRGDSPIPLLGNTPFPSSPVDFLAHSCIAAPGCRLGSCTSCSLHLMA